MKTPQQLQTLVDRLVGDSLDAGMAALRETLATKLAEDITRQLPALDQSAEPGPAAASASGLPSAAARLQAAFEHLQAASTQADILSALLESGGSFAPRLALFVLRSGSFVAWRARGISGEYWQGALLENSIPLVEHVLNGRVPAHANSAKFTPAFCSSMGIAPQGVPVLLVPLLVRQKVTALVYADGLAQADGQLQPDAARSGGIDIDALLCLVRFAGLWIELLAARKSGGATLSEPEPRWLSTPTPDSQPAGEQLPVNGSTSHKTDAAMAAPPPLSRPHPEHSGNGVAAPLPAANGFDSSLAASAPASSPVLAAGRPQAISAQTTVAEPAEQELQHKARRFAKLLVDEIKLYHQQEVEEGRRQRDLYPRLRTEIDKSRSAYDKRYGHSSVAASNYFQQELVRILANNDPALLGSADSG